VDEQSISVWAAVAIAVGSGLVIGALGAFASAWWNARHERREHWRSRLIEAADAFARNAVDGRAALRVLARAVAPGKGETLPSQGEVKQAQEVFSRTNDELRANVARLELLFGPTSDVVAAANDFVEGMGGMYADVRPDRDPQTARRAIADALVQMMKAQRVFAKLAHNAIRKTDPSI
jgi:hypothetical protein